MRREYGFEEFHIQTKNSLGHKNILNSYQIHYDPHIVDLQMKAPLQLSKSGRNATSLATEKEENALTDLIQKRRTCREFSDAKTSFAQFSCLLRFANGVQNGPTSYPYKRNVPNSGNLGSVEIFPLVANVDGLVAGLYHHDTIGKKVTLLQEGNFVSWLHKQVLFQPEFASASVIFILTASVGRLAEKYGARGYRLGLLDVGLVSQNINLVATSMDLGVACTAGFVDDEVEKFLGIDGISIAAFLLIAVGPKRND